MRRPRSTEAARLRSSAWPLYPLLVVLLLLCSCSIHPTQQGVSAFDSGSTGVAGSVQQPDGSPAAGAFVYAYRSASNGLRGPADFGIKVEPDGRYFLDLVEGEYHLVARLRLTGADVGPPRPGDAWSLYRQNPVQVAAGQIIQIDFKLQSGVVPHQIRQGSLTSGDTGFRGRLLDADGQPFAGAFALAYRSTDFHRMPDLTSAPADAEGQFVLYVPDPGEYCLAARSKTRGQPRAGEPYGTLGPKADACRQVSSGEILDIGVIRLTPYRSF